MTGWRVGRFVLAAAAVLAAGCSVARLPQTTSEAIGTGRVLALVGIEGRWAGPVTPSDASTCGPERHGLMRIGNGTFAFDPFESTTIVSGKVEGDALNGTLTRVGGGRQALAITFDGHAHMDEGGPEAITGVVTSGRCKWQAQLSRS